jgi:hypothetical protein
MLSNGNATETQGIDTLQGLSALIWQALAPTPATPSAPTGAAG